MWCKSSEREEKDGDRVLVLFSSVFPVAPIRRCGVNDACSGKIKIRTDHNRNCLTRKACPAQSLPGYPTHMHTSTVFVIDRQLVGYSLCSL